MRSLLPGSPAKRLGAALLTFERAVHEKIVMFGAMGPEPRDSRCVQPVPPATRRVRRRPQSCTDADALNAHEDRNSGCKEKEAESTRPDSTISLKPKAVTQALKSAAGPSSCVASTCRATGACLRGMAQSGDEEFRIQELLAPLPQSRMRSRATC